MKNEYKQEFSSKNSSPGLFKEQKKIFQKVTTDGATNEKVHSTNEFKIVPLGN